LGEESDGESIGEKKHPQQKTRIHLKKKKRRKKRGVEKAAPPREWQMIRKARRRRAGASTGPGCMTSSRREKEKHSAKDGK